MDVRQLRCFIGVVEAGSFTAAAHRLGVAQPALSQTVIALENDLGVDLLERQPRGVRPTAAGMTLLDHARIVLRNMERAREAVSDADGDVSGRVAIGLPSTVAPLLAVPLMKEAMQTLPGVAVHLVESHSGFLREWLDVSRLDLAVLFNVANTDGVDILPLVIEDLHVVSLSQSRSPKGDISLRHIRGMRLIMAGQSHDLRDTLDDALFLATKQRLTVTAEVDSLPTIKQMVIAGLGATVLPLANVQTELADGRLTARRIVRPAIERHASLVSLARRPTTRAQKAVAGLVVKVTAQLVSQGVWPARRS
jgi:LysR family nitrogen assimilation transcriptional regulator